MTDSQIEALDSSGLSATPGTPAPHVRRLLALWLDVSVAAVAAVVAISLAQFAKPSESPAWLIGSVFLGLSVGSAYLGLAPLYPGNTLGKQIFSLRVVSADERPLSGLRLLKRLLLLGLVPINAVMVLSRGSRAHLGDSWARTHVVLSHSRRNFWVALIAAGLVLFVLFELGTGAALVGVLRSEAWRAAKIELASEPGATAPVFPESFSIVGDLASFDADVGHGMRRIVVARSRDGRRWNLVSNVRVDEH